MGIHSGRCECMEHMIGNQKRRLSEHIVKLVESANFLCLFFRSQVIPADWHLLEKLSITRAAPVYASFVSLVSLSKRLSEHVFHKKSTSTYHYGPLVQVLVH